MKNFYKDGRELTEAERSYIRKQCADAMPYQLRRLLDSPETVVQGWSGLSRSAQSWILGTARTEKLRAEAIARCDELLERAAATRRGELARTGPVGIYCAAVGHGFNKKES